MDRDSQKALAATMALAAGFAATFDKDASKKQSHEELMKKHGVEKGSGEEGLKNVEDVPALAVDLIDWVEKNTPQDKKGNGSMAKNVGQTVFSDFKTDGDSATAKAVGPVTVDTAYFKKVDGKWYVDMATMMKKQMKTSPFPKKK